MAYNIFLDVNILVDFFDGSRQHHEPAKQLMQKIEDEMVKAFTSESVISTTVYLIQKGYAPKDLHNIINQLTGILFILPCSNKTIQSACLLPTNDLEDAILYQLAIENKLDYFITHDKTAYKKLTTPILPVVSAREFLKLPE